MPKYDIHRWDAVITKGNDHPIPMIYIKPDKSFVNYAKENDFQVLVDIQGTGTVYDGKPILAVIDSSAYFPDYRPNFYNEENYFVLSLMTQWDGYPKTGNGSILIRGLKGPDSVQIPQNVPTETVKPIPAILEPYTDKNNKNNLSSAQIGWFLTGLLVVFCVFLYISFKKSGSK